VSTSKLLLPSVNWGCLWNGERQLISYAAFTPGHMLPGNMYPGRATCIRIHIGRRTHVAGYKLLVKDTCGRHNIGDIITIHLCHGRLVLYHFVSINRRATNWRQLCPICRRYKIHVESTATSGYNLYPARCVLV